MISVRQGPANGSDGYTAVLETQIVCYHGDKLGICGFPAGILNGIPEEGIQHLQVASVPCHFDGMAYRTLNARCGGAVQLGDRRIKHFCNGIDDVNIVDDHYYGAAQVSVSFYMGGHSYLVDDLCHLGFEIVVFFACAVGRALAAFVSYALDPLRKHREIHRFDHTV